MYSVIFRLTSQPVELVKSKLIKLKGLQIEESIELLDRKKQNTTLTRFWDNFL